MKHPFLFVMFLYSTMLIKDKTSKQATTKILSNGSEINKGFLSKKDLTSWRAESEHPTGLFLNNFILTSKLNSEEKCTVGQIELLLLSVSSFCNYLSFLPKNLQETGSQRDET